MPLTRNPQSKVLIGTLGTEPQVITLALWALRNQLSPPEYPQEVWVIHTSEREPAIRESLERLQNAFATDERLQVPHPVLLKTFPIASPSGQRFADLENLRAVKATFRTLFQVIKQAKEAGFKVHLCVAGGRKPMSIFGTVATQLLFDDQDGAWHLISSKSLVESRKLFTDAPAEWVKLVPIPIITWSDVDPILTLIAREEDPFEAADLVKALRERRRRYTLRLFIKGYLSPAERRVLRVVVERGGTIAEIAKVLGKKPRTVEHQIQSIYRKIKDNQEFLGLEIPEDTRLTRDFLGRMFGGVY